MDEEAKAIRLACERTRLKVEQEQRGVPTIFDNLVFEQGMAYLHNTDKPHEMGVAMLRRAMDTLRMSGSERFVEVTTRLRRLPVSDLDAYARLCSQGVRSCFRWRGQPLFKSVQDLAIYQMLLPELRPATIIEIGSTAVSLCWLKDMSDLFALGAQIVGVDWVLPSWLPQGVQFRQGNVRDVHDVLYPDLLAALPHPWLIIEDAHNHILAVLRYLGRTLFPGDYLVIEDSLNKQDQVLQWAREEPERFVVDSLYTDFFGINATSAVNTIITRPGLGVSSA